VKNKILTILSIIIISLFIGSCHNATEPPPQEEKSLLTGKIVFSSVIDGITGIYTINPDGTGLKQILVLTGGGGPKWSPDGTLIVYTAPSVYSINNYAVYVMNADGSNAHIVPAQPATLSTGRGQQWSPDGEKIIYSHSLTEDLVAADIIVIVDLNSGTTKEFKNDYVTYGGYISDEGPKWSPDGKKIIFRSNRDAKSFGRYDLYLMDTEGKNIKRLTHNGGTLINYLWYQSDQSIIFSVGQNKDVTSDGIGHVDTAGNLLWYNDMQGIIRFGKLSNDGKRLAFSSTTGIIQILDIQSKSIQNVIVNSVSDYRYIVVDWSIDDKELLVISRPQNSLSSGYLEMVKISNGIVKRLLNDALTSSADWHK
jgi:Tol biopolymer transport system component